MTHLTWSVEKSDCCPSCGATPVLVTAPDVWKIDYEDLGDGEENEADIYEEVSGLYCRTCRQLVALSLNTP